MRIIASSILIVLVIGWAELAYAYIGPGLGVGAIVAILGVIASVFIAILSLFWYPFKRILKKLKILNK